MYSGKFHTGRISCFRQKVRKIQRGREREREVEAFGSDPVSGKMKPSTISVFFFFFN